MRVSSSLDLPRVGFDRRPPLFHGENRRQCNPSCPAINWHFGPVETEDAVDGHSYNLVNMDMLPSSQELIPMSISRRSNEVLVL
jgi:hypothetical protein